MKKKKLLYFISFLLAFILMHSCSRMNNAKDLFIKPTAKEIYERDFAQDPVALADWKIASEKALFDSIAISLPYSEAGNFSATTSEVYTYNISLNPGERLRVDVNMDSLNSLVFLDLYQQEIDSVIGYKHLESADFGEAEIQHEAEQPGIYKLLVQPEIGATSGFQLKLSKEPVYTFPVVGKRQHCSSELLGCCARWRQEKPRRN